MSWHSNYGSGYWSTLCLFSYLSYSNDLLYWNFPFVWVIFLHWPRACHWDISECEHYIKMIYMDSHMIVQKIFFKNL